MGRELLKSRAEPSREVFLPQLRRFLSELRGERIALLIAVEALQILFLTAPERPKCECAIDFPELPQFARPFPNLRKSSDGKGGDVSNRLQVILCCRILPFFLTKANLKMKRFTESFCVSQTY